MKKNEVKNISFQIKAIELLEYALNAPKQPMQDNPVYQYDIQLQQRINNERNLVIVVCSVTISNDSRDQNYGNIKASCIYEVPELKSFIDADTKQVTFPDQFVITLNSVSISTTRGIASSMFRGTFLHNAIMPIIDPTAFQKAN